MISSRCSGRSSRWTSPYSGTSCSIRRRIRSVAETTGLIPSRSKCSRLRGLLTRAMTRSTQVLLLRDLADQHVVLVVAGDRDHHVGARDPGPLEHPELGGVAVVDVVLELLLDRQVALAVGLDQGHLVALLDQLAGQVPADLAGADDDHVLAPLSARLDDASRLRAYRRPLAPLARDLVLEHLDRHPGRADRVQALVGVPLGPVGVEDPRDHLRHAKRRWAIWAMTMFVLSPSVEATKTSARSIPAVVQRLDLERRADREMAAERPPTACRARSPAARATPGPRPGRRPRGPRPASCARGRTRPGRPRR